MPAIVAFIGHTELIILLVIALLLFGTRLPKIARSLGQGIREFKGGLKGVKDEMDDAGEDPPKK